MSRVASTNFGAFGGFTAAATTGKALNSSTSKVKDPSNTKNCPKIEPNDYVPKRFGLKYSPPSIIVEYLVPSSGKLYHHKIKISNLKADLDTWDALDAIKKKNPLYFTGNKIADNQITELINRLKKKLQENSAGGTFITGGGLGENKDGSSKFGKLASLSSNLSNKTNQNLASLDGNKIKGGAGTKTIVKEDKKNDGSNNFWAFDDLEDLEEDEEKTDYSSKNLNKLSTDELQRHKSKMDVLFNKNQKKPGDQDFQYDKQEEFVATQDNDWDEEF